jgi:ketosteroid isomerase-like protein
MKSLNKLIFIPIFSLATGLASAEALETTDVENINNVWATTLDEGKTKELMGLYTENAVVFPPSSEILNGRTEIQAYLDSLREAGFKEYSISNVNSDVKGDNTIFETAIWEATRMDAEGNVITLEGNISNVFEKQNDGSWKIKFQSWN